jgi:hypothetical protein
MGNRGVPIGSMGTEAMADNYQKIKASIKATSGNRALSGNYKGQPELRKLWPLILGYTNNVAMVLCYQYDDGSGDDPDDPAPLKNLRCFKVGQFGTTLDRIDYEGDVEPPYLTFEQVKEQTNIKQVKVYREQPDP